MWVESVKAVRDSGSILERGSIQTIDFVLHSRAASCVLLCSASKDKGCTVREVRLVETERRLKLY